MSGTGHGDDLSRRRARRAQARRERTLLRADVAAGSVVAIIGLIVAPGLAIVAIVALAVLAVCGVWLLIERRRARRSERMSPPHRPE